MQIIVLVEVNGVQKWKVCESPVEARRQAVLWLEAAGKSFPNKKFTPMYFQGRRVE